MKKRLSQLKKNKYRTDGDKFFLNYLPPKLFDKLNESKREHYREYRRYHLAIFNTNERVEKLRNQIEKIKKQILIEKDKLKADDYKDGYNLKMKLHYNHLSDLDKKYKFNVSGSWRDKSSRSYKESVGILSTDKRDSTKVSFVQKTFKGKKIEKRESLYLHISSTDSTLKELKQSESLPSNRKNIAFGGLENCRLALSEIYNEDWSKDDKDIVKDEVKIVVRGYVRYYIFKKGWSKFVRDTHSRDKIVEWSKGLGDDFYNWI